MVNTTPITAPANCAAMNNGTDFNEIPVNDSLKVLASVIAGFANEVEEVKI
jgi:hypothetical protein